MRDLVTTLLDVLGLVLIAAGIGALAWKWVGPSALTVTGVLILFGSWWGSRQGE